MANWRKGADGHLFAPRRGKAPECPEGYEPTGDPYIFKIKLPECPYRTTEHETCCGGSLKTICQVVNKPVRRLTCVDCQANPEWIENASKHHDAGV